MSLATTIKSHRLALKMTQEDLAKALRLQRVTIATYETGRGNPSLDVAQRMAAIFHCSMDELLQDHPTPAAIREEVPSA